MYILSFLDLDFSFFIWSVMVMRFVSSGLGKILEMFFNASFLRKGIVFSLERGMNTGDLEVLSDSTFCINTGVDDLVLEMGMDSVVSESELGLGIKSELPSLDSDASIIFRARFFNFSTSCSSPHFFL